MQGKIMREANKEGWEKQSEAEREGKKKGGREKRREKEREEWIQYMFREKKIYKEIKLPVAYEDDTNIEEGSRSVFLVSCFQILFQFQPTRLTK